MVISKKSKLKSIKTEKIDEFQQKYGITNETITKAITAELNFMEKKLKKKNLLFTEKYPLQLQIVYIKIPEMFPKILRLQLKHSLYDKDSEICLILPDIKTISAKEHEKHLEIYEDLLARKNVQNIKKLMTFHEFRTEYETFELRRRLVDLYDVFLVDGRISGPVVRKCGKIFYQKHKIPTSIKMNVSKLKEHIDTALMKTQTNLHANGNCFTIQFGHSNMEMNELCENVKAIIDGLDREIPGGFDNIRSISVKAHGGLRLPIHISFKNQNDLGVIKKINRKVKHDRTVVGELSTIPNANVVVKPDGDVIVKRSK